MRPQPPRPQPTRRRRALKVLASLEPRRKASRIPPRLLLFGAGGLLAFVILWWLLTPPVPPQPAVLQPLSSAAAKVYHPSPPDKTSEAITAQTHSDNPALIAAVRIVPSQPTREDVLKAEVTSAPDAPGPLSLSFLWRVNDVPVAQGETFKLSNLKKGDLVSVTVTPYFGDQAGVSLTSQPVRVYSIPPSLTLEIKEPKTNFADPLIMQLVSVPIDTKVLSFALEEPYLTGMTLEASSGRIIWKRPPDARGTFRFGASVTDEEGTKVTKVFEITVQ